MCKESLIDFDKYEITKDGKIFSKSYNKNRYLKGYVNPIKGYVQLTLMCTNGKRRTFLLHRVIYFYFNGDIPKDMEVNHIDECKTNNALSNLNLLSHTDNNNWGTRTQRATQSNTNNPKLSRPVEQIDRATGEIIATYPSSKEAARQTGFIQSAISKCCNGGYHINGKWVNISHSYGYIWRWT